MKPIIFQLSVVVLFLTVSPLVFAQQDVVKRLYLDLSLDTKMVIENNGTTLLVNNYLSSNSLEINPDGKIETQNYSPYGNTTDGNIQEDKLFTNHRILDDLSLYHAGARFYSPTVGQFIQPDMVEGPNRYAYVGNSPISFVDMDGNNATSVIVDRIVNKIKEATIHMFNRRDSSYQALMKSHRGSSPSEIMAIIRAREDFLPRLSRAQYFERTSGTRKVSSADMELWNARLGDDPEFARMVASKNGNLRPDTRLYRSQDSIYMGTDGMQAGNPNSSARVYDVESGDVSSLYIYKRGDLNSTNASLQDRLAFLDSVQAAVKEGSYYAHGTIDASSLGPTLNMIASSPGISTQDLFGYAGWGKSLMRIDLMDILRVGGRVYKDTQACGCPSAYIFTIPEPVPYVEVAKFPPKKMK